MTQVTLFKNLKGLRLPDIAGSEPLLNDLRESVDSLYYGSLGESPIDYLRLTGSYPKATLKKVFSKLGLRVTRVNNKGKNGRKTIVHFEDVSNSSE